MIKLKPKNIVVISKLIIKLFRYAKDGLDASEREELANELTDIVVELMSHR